MLRLHCHSRESGNLTFVSSSFSSFFNWSVSFHDQDQEIQNLREQVDNLNEDHRSEIHQLNVEKDNLADELDRAHDEIQALKDDLDNQDRDRDQDQEEELERLRTEREEDKVVSFSPSSCLVFE